VIIDIETDTGIEKYNLFNFIYTGQRFFATGVNESSNKKYNFISTKGFDQILMSSLDGIDYNFTKKHMNPYLCERVKDSVSIFKESEIIQTIKTTIKDIGPSSFTGSYKIVKTDQAFVDNFYFETIPFKYNGFDLFKYQNDDMYFIQHQSKLRDGYPKLINLFDVDVYNKINVIHAVNDDGEDYFDINSLNQICDADLGYPDKNSFYKIIRASGFSGVIKPTKVGPIELIKLAEILQFKNDCGNLFIQKNINKKLSRRKFAFRYLYEYFQLLESICSVRRKQSIKGQSGVKGFKKEEFVPIFFNETISDFKIIYFKEVYSIERKHNVQKVVPGDPIFYIDAYYDFNTGCIRYHNFESTSQITKKIKEKFGTTTSIRFAKAVSEWFPNTFGYVPLTTKLPMSQKANPSPLTDNLTLYTIPIREDDSDEVFGADTYVNLYEYLANFGIHHIQIRNMLNANRFSPKLFKLLDKEFPVYNICRDTRRKIYSFDDVNDQDKELISLMFPVTYGLPLLISLLSQSGSNKNSYWFSNANRLIQSMPPGDIISTFYTQKELQGHLNDESI
jgi:hypothetical protein